MSSLPLPEHDSPASGQVRSTPFLTAGDALLAAIVESSDDAIIAKDLDGIIRSWNRGAERMFGYTAEEVIGQPVSLLAVSDRQNEMPAILDLIRHGERVDHFETQRRTKHGDILTVSLSVSPIRDAAGTIVGASKIARDITAQRRMAEASEQAAAARQRVEEALREREGQLALFIETAPAGIAMFDREMRYLAISRRFREDFRLPEDILGRSHYELFPNLPERWKEAHRRCLAGAHERVEEDSFTTPDGRVEWLSWEIQPWYTADGNQAGVVLASELITERKRIKEELRHAAQRFRFALRNSSVSVFEQDRDLRYTWAHNESPLFAPELLRGKTDEELNPGPWWNEITPVKRRILSTGVGERHEFIIPVQGQPTYYDMSLEPLRDAESTIIGLSGSAVNITALKRVEQELRESEERHRFLAEAMPQFVWTRDASGQINYINRHWTEYTGLTLEQARAGGWLELIHPDDRPRALAVRQLAEQGKDFELEYRFRRKSDGMYRWHLARGRFVPRSKEGTTWIGTATDIHDRKEAESRSQLLAEAGITLVSSLRYEETLKAVAKLAVPAFADWSAVDLLDEEQRLQRVAVEHSDPARVEFAHEFHRRYPPREDDATWLAIRTGQSFFMAEIPDALITERARDAEHARQVRELGLRSFIVTPMVARGRVLGVLTFATAESGRRYTEADVAFAEDLAYRAAVAIDNARLYAAVQSSEGRFRELANAVPALVWTTTPSGEITYFNERWYEYTGLTPEQSLGTAWAGTMPPEDVERVLPAWNDACARGVPYNVECRYRSAQGEYRWFMARALPVRDEAGRIIQWFGTSTDIHEAKLAEDSLRRANRELEEFAYVGSHDLQEPLRMVNIYTQLLLKRFVPDQPDAREYADYIHSGVKRMEQLIQDLLAFSRTVHESSMPAASRADLSASLAEAMSVLQRRIEDNGAKVIVGPLPIVCGDTQQIAQVFQNLIGNSLKYRKPDVAPEIRITATQADGHCVVAVSDNGIGFEPQYARKIFGLFKRLYKDEYPGTGLGLAICQRIIERYGGRMWAEGEPGVSSTFYFSLPLAEVH